MRLFRVLFHSPGGVCQSPLALLPRRGYASCTPRLLSGAAPHGPFSQSRVSRSTAPGASSLHNKSSSGRGGGGGGVSGASSAAPGSSASAQRAEEIRRREVLLLWLRRLVIPAFSIWGLYVLRPTEGHFVRYVAERRHLDTDFNAWFPPVATAAAAVAAPAPQTVKSEKERAALAKGQEDVVAAAFRTEQDRDWAAQRFQYRKGSKDEERVARRRLLFARERAYLPDDTVVETIRSPAAQMEELRAQREHPPMHLLSEQLNAMVAESREFGRTAGAASPPPQVLVEFQDHTLYATASITFRDAAGNVGRTMRFFGACGMLWRQLS